VPDSPISGIFGLPLHRVCAGAATSPRSLDELDHLVQRADSHLMQAKRDGRDRVICNAVQARSGWGGDPKAAAPE
jgi:GGDEF domain-containing protein